MLLYIWLKVVFLKVFPGNKLTLCQYKPPYYFMSDV